MTSALLASAPKLKNADPAQLGARLTNAYVRLTIGRSLLKREAEGDERLFHELRSLGAAQEAIALTVGHGDLRTSAAFVAASAYKLTADLEGTSRAGNTLLNASEVSASIAAMLLFLAADSPAEAAEVAQSIEVPEGHPFQSLIARLRSFALGRSDFALDETHPEQPATAWIDSMGDPNRILAMVGFSECETLLAGLQRQLAGDPEAVGWIKGQFQSVADKMTFDYPEGFTAIGHNTYNLVPGPWHLAKLIDMAEEALLSAATVSVAAPAAVPPVGWLAILRRIARVRPVLWRNHRDAIGRGMLEPGVSAVLAYPTGAGKSTVTEMKIATCVLRGENVIVLAPTLSLVDQLGRSLGEIIPNAEIVAVHDTRQVVLQRASGQEQIFVMTPEACLAASGGDPDFFGTIGLIVFDEVHLMHAGDAAPSRRGIDASLCLLSLVEQHPDADVLLSSAMLANAGELAAWLHELTGRKTLALDHAWKPTRQARGALVYPRDEIDALRDKLKQGFATHSSKGVPVQLKREIVATPHAFFSLNATWQSKDTRDYRFARIIENEVQLGTSGNRDKDGAWWLTANVNTVAAEVASAGAAAGMKTLVFVHQVRQSSKTAEAVTTALPSKVVLTPAEADLLRRSVDVLGSESALYLDLEGEAVVSAAIPHHGLLLPDERRLHESLYRRADGVPVMVATSTVSQGMNFPSEFVVIAGDRRFDLAANSQTPLAAHELLNAAGRAGRAGSRSHALVLVIPGQVVAYDGKGSMGKAWFELRNAFAQSDQCVTMRDALSAVLETDEEPTGEILPVIEYIGRRLEDTEDAVMRPSSLRRSFAAYVARASGTSERFERGIARVVASQLSADAPQWLRRSSRASGLPPSDIEYFASQLETALLNDIEDNDINWWSNWLFDNFDAKPGLLQRSLREGTWALLRGAPSEVDEWSLTGSVAVAQLRKLLPLWLAGATLSEIQEAGRELGLTRSGDIVLEFARKFALRMVPEIAYLASVPALIHEQKQHQGLAEQLDEMHPVNYLSRCVEAGVDSVVKARLLDAGFDRGQAHAIDD